jgi:hypothetical protein
MRIHPTLLLLCPALTCQGLACQGARGPAEPSGGSPSPQPVAAANAAAAATGIGVTLPAMPKTEVPDAGAPSARDQRARPRCNSADSNCLPLPYWSPELTADAQRAGMRTPPYDPTLGRELIDVSSWNFNQGTCKGDGGCVRNGCGNHCAAWQIQPFAAHCPAYNELSDAHCGCVQGQCGWFAQVPESHFSVSVGVPTVTQPGHAAGELAQSLPLGWIERQFRDCYAGALERLPVDVVLSFDLDGRGRLLNTTIASPDAARTPCLLRAVRQMTLPHPPLPAKQRQRVEMPLKLFLDPGPLKLDTPAP